MAEGGDAATVAHEAGNAVQETPKAEPEKAAAAAEPAAPAEPAEPTVRTIVLTGHGGYDKLSVQQKPQPKAGKGEVLVRVKAAGLNFSELMVRQGLHDRMAKPPVVLGMEAAGVVEELGEDVSGLEVGQNVICLAQTGMWREVVAVPATNVFLMPEEMSYEEGAAIPLSYLTAYFMLFDFGNLRPGKSLLVHIAAGGVGWAATQLAKTVDNVTVFGTASASKHDAIKENGVDHPIDYRTRDYSEEIKNISPKGVDVVLDPLGGADTSKGLQLLRPMGKIITYGSANMVKGENRNLMKMAKTLWQSTSVSPVSLVKTNKAIAGFQLAHLTGEIDLVRSAFQDILNMYKDGKIKPRIDSVWAFEQVAEAMQQMNERRNIGKVILSPEKEPTKPAEGDAVPTSPIKKKKPSLFRRLSKRASRSKDEGEKKDEVKNAKKESPIKQEEPEKADDNKATNGHIQQTPEDEKIDGEAAKKLRARLSGGDPTIEDSSKVVNDKLEAAEDKIGSISKTVDGKVGEAEKAAEDSAKKIEDNVGEAKEKVEDAKKTVEAQVEQTAGKLPDTGTSAKIAVDDIFKEAEAKVDGNIQQKVDGTVEPSELQVEEGGVAAKVAMFEQIDAILPEDDNSTEKLPAGRTAGKGTRAPNFEKAPVNKKPKETTTAFRPNSTPQQMIKKSRTQKTPLKGEKNKIEPGNRTKGRNLKVVGAEIYMEAVIEEPIIKEAVHKDLVQRKAPKKVVKNKIFKKLNKEAEDIWVRRVGEDGTNEVPVNEVPQEGKEEVSERKVKEDVPNDVGKEAVLSSKVSEGVLKKDVPKESSMEELHMNVKEKVTKEDEKEALSKEEVTKEDVKEDIPKKVVKEDIPKEVVKEDIPKEEGKEEMPKEDVKEEMPKENVKEDIPKEDVKEEMPKEEVKDEVTDQDVKNEVAKEHVKEEMPKEDVKEEMQEEVVEEMPKKDVKEEIQEEVVKEEMRKEEVKEEMPKDAVKEEVAKEDVEEEISRKYVKEEMPKEDLKEKVTKEDLKKEVTKEDEMEELPTEDVGEEIAIVDLQKDLPNDDTEDDFEKITVEKGVKNAFSKDIQDNGVLEKEISIEKADGEAVDTKKEETQTSEVNSKKGQEGIMPLNSVAGLPTGGIEKYSDKSEDVNDVEVNDDSSDHSLPPLILGTPVENGVGTIVCEDSEVEDLSDDESDNSLDEDANDIKSDVKSSDHDGGTGRAHGTSTAENVEEKLEEGKEKAGDLVQQAEEKVEEAVKQEEAPTEPAAQEEKKEEAPAVEEPEKTQVTIENPAETDDAKAAAADIVPADDKPVENEEKGAGDASQEAE